MRRQMPGWVVALIVLWALPAAAQKLSVGDDEDDGPRPPMPASARRQPEPRPQPAGAARPPAERTAATAPAPRVAPTRQGAGELLPPMAPSAGSQLPAGISMRRPPMKPMVEAFDDLLEEATRPVRVRLGDGSIVWGRVHAEQAGAVVVETSIGRIAIPRGRIQAMWYDDAAGAAPDRPISYPVTGASGEGRARAR